MSLGNLKLQPQNRFTSAKLKIQYTDLGKRIYATIKPKFMSAKLKIQYSYLLILKTYLISLCDT